MPGTGTGTGGRPTTVAHHYDPSIVFHSHSTNLPHLSSWIEDLLRLTDRTIPAQSTPSTEQLVQALQRYDACFKELLGQTKIFSDDLCKLYSKMWIGVIKLLETMIKVYHRYVKQTSKTQEHAQKLINERQAQLAAQKVHNEEVELERAAMRAKIRNLEGDLAGMGVENRSLHRENQHLRNIIESFIESKGQIEGFQDLKTPDESIFKQSKPQLDPAHVHLKTVCNLDSEMNDLLANVLKEEERQRYVLGEFTSLLERNADILGISVEINARGEGVTRPAMVDAGVQSDEIIGHGVVKVLEPDEDEPLPKVPSIPPPKEPTEKTADLGAQLPYQLRDLMSSFPVVLRIPPCYWAVKTIFSIYFAMIRHEDQLRQKQQPSMLPNALSDKRTPLWKFAYDHYVRQYEIPAVAEIFLSQLIRACDHHLRRNKSVLVFSYQMGLTSLHTAPDYDPCDTSFILRVIRQLASLGELVGDLSFEAIDNSTLPSGLVATGNSIYTARDGKQSNSQFAMSQSIISINSNKSQSIRLKDPNGNIAPGEFRPEVSRSSAAAATRAIFDKWYPDRGEDCAMKVEAMPASKRDGKHLSIHDYMELSIEQWKAVRVLWEDHIQYLFSTYCCVYHAVHPAYYFNDRGVRGKDAVLVLTTRAAPGEPKKRVVNFYERFVTAARSNELNRGQHSHEDGGGGYNTDWVFELMPLKIFGAVLAMLKPDITPHEVNLVYQDACQIQNDATLFKLKELWSEYPTRYEAMDPALGGAILPRPDEAVDISKLPKTFYVNNITKNAQWTTPYYKNSFPAVDIEISAFMKAIMNRDIMEKCPLLEFFHMSPKDLWSNTDIFYRQIEQARLKERRNKRATNIMQQRNESAKLDSQLVME